eukprot:TRINITY_DN17357_c0_g1_i1.p1 TRINITY_DN17357_c0_g1~~TRINITY_DN17357_c0_g1_i1.p1  ORF type:complete len:317 (+),score=60.51 TRINITY_DN17357_c0_g1_i1:83-1033(+)
METVHLIVKHPEDDVERTVGLTTEAIERVRALGARDCVVVGLDSITFLAEKNLAKMCLGGDEGMKSGVSEEGQGRRAVYEAEAAEWGEARVASGSAQCSQDPSLRTLKKLQIKSISEDPPLQLSQILAHEAKTPTLHQTPAISSTGFTSCFEMHIPQSQSFSYLISKLAAVLSLKLWLLTSMTGSIKLIVKTPLKAVCEASVVLPSPSSEYPVLHCCVRGLWDSLRFAPSVRPVGIGIASTLTLPATKRCPVEAPLLLWKTRAVLHTMDTDSLQKVIEAANRTTQNYEAAARLLASIKRVRPDVFHRYGGGARFVL